MQVAYQLLVYPCFYAKWKDYLKVDIEEAQPKVVKETGCFHITQDIPFMFFFSSVGTCHLIFLQQQLIP